MSRPIAVPKTSAMASPSATAVRVAPVARRNAGSVMTCGIAENDRCRLRHIRPAPAPAHEFPHKQDREAGQQSRQERAAQPARKAACLWVAATGTADASKVDSVTA